MISYNQITPYIYQELCNILDTKYVIFNDADRLEPFSHDEIPGKEYRSMPEVVVRPRTTEEIAKIVKLANREKIAITPRGAGSGLSGGAVPIHGGIVISVERMNTILEIDRENMMVVVEPGVIANEINESIKEFGLFYAGYPMSMETCFIGGNVAENAGGGKAVKYGVTSRYVLGLEMVTPVGDIVELGGKLVKDVTGYNMVHLMIGSEGTLGIFTKIILKLIPLPKYQVDLLCLFDSSQNAIAAVPEIMTGSGYIPTSIEFMDSESVKSACDYLNESLPYKDCGAMLLISVDGMSQEQITREYEEIGRFCQKCGALEVYVADNASTTERIWKIRRSIPESYNLFSQRQSGEDIVVPPASIPQVVAKLGELAKKYRLQIPCFGHAGDGNLHARIVSDPAWTDEYWHELLPQILEQVYSLTAACGGRISGEHGIGHKRKKYMPKVVSPEYLTMLKAIKKALDPNNIMNPGKIFDL